MSYLDHCPLLWISHWFQSGRNRFSKKWVQCNILGCLIFQWSWCPVHWPSSCSPPPGRHVKCPHHVCTPVGIHTWKRHCSIVSWGIGIHWTQQNITPEHVIVKFLFQWQWLLPSISNLFMEPKWLTHPAGTSKDSDKCDLSKDSDMAPLTLGSMENTTYFYFTQETYVSKYLGEIYIWKNL